MIAFVLLSGSSPFKFEHDHETQNAIIECDFKFDDSVWAERSKQSQTFIKKCLQKSPKCRPSAGDLLDDEWFAARPRLSKRRSTTSILDDVLAEENALLGDENPNKKTRFSLNISMEETVL